MVYLYVPMCITSVHVRVHATRWWLYDWISLCVQYLIYSWKRTHSWQANSSAGSVWAGGRERNIFPDLWLMNWFTRCLLSRCARHVFVLISIPKWKKRKKVSVIQHKCGTSERWRLKNICLRVTWSPQSDTSWRWDVLMPVTVPRLKDAEHNLCCYLTRSGGLRAATPCSFHTTKTFITQFNSICM